MMIIQKNPIEKEGLFEFEAKLWYIHQLKITMCPIEVYSGNKFIGRIGPEKGQLTLPDPPKGVVTWTGDKEGQVFLNLGPNGSPFSFSLFKEGDSGAATITEPVGSLGGLKLSTSYEIKVKRI